MNILMMWHSEEIITIWALSIFNIDSINSYRGCTARRKACFKNDLQNINDDYWINHSYLVTGLLFADKMIGIHLFHKHGKRLSDSEVTSSSQTRIAVE